MENVNHYESEDHNDVHVVAEEKGEYELARESLKEASEQL